MGNIIKSNFLRELNKRYGSLRRMHRTQSLYEIGKGEARLYIRYSKVHERGKTFYGLRKEDLKNLEGHPSLICFLWDEQPEPLLIPFSAFEDVFQLTPPASDGQYKAQIRLQNEGTELYISRAGRFNVEGHFGWGELDSLIYSTSSSAIQEFSHSQMQTFLGAIGTAKNHDIWIPPNDRGKLDWSLAEPFKCCINLQYGPQRIKDILQEVDVIWIQRGSSELGALFEVEHTTPIYSALLRFNDIHLESPTLCQNFYVVSNNEKRDLFVRQLNRPTFQKSRLSEVCTFLEYINVFNWYNRIRAQQKREGGMDDNKNNF